MQPTPTKVLIKAYKANTYDKANYIDEFQATINPETYSLNMKMVVDPNQGFGTSGNELKFIYKAPNSLNFDFLFDNTGILDGKPNRAGVQSDIEKLQKLVFKMDGTVHEPYHLELVWGNFHFFGRATDMSINYKLFNANGAPIRAMVKLTIVHSIEGKERSADEGKNSPDLTHKRIFRKGDSLPWLCNEIYGSPKYYVQVARANDISNFREIKPGTEIFFPPFAKTA